MAPGRVTPILMSLCTHHNCPNENSECFLHARRKFEEWSSQLISALLGFEEP